MCVVGLCFVCKPEPPFQIFSDSVSVIQEEGRPSPPPFLCPPIPLPLGVNPTSKGQCVRRAGSSWCPFLDEGFTSEIPGIREGLEEAPQKEGEDGKEGVRRPVWKAGRVARMKQRMRRQQQQRPRVFLQHQGPSKATWVMAVLRGLCQQGAPRACASMGSLGQQNLLGAAA